ncbi:molybdopterin converting factor subunit 1 [Sandaracinobacteroides hominis]|uniref:molybdopterin converting factor subunit 1 n=1 Tax=Sandaracinobacteroides hominis TaxID=2780086 RepID=UPI0018F4D5AC|nr:molybdopterin converting factor subunit 1 [Sandaracinobacteroides hominis]
MTVRLLYFAWVREQVGLGEEVVDAETPVPLGALLGQLQTLSPGHKQALADRTRLRAAINQNFAGWDTPVNAGDEVAIFPPVTGGN